MSAIPEAVARELLARPDAEYAELDDEGLRAIRRAASRHRLEGFAVACPTRIVGGSIPLLVLYARDARRAAEVVGSRNEIVLAAPLGRGLAATGPLRAPRADKRPVVDAEGNPKGPVAPSPDARNPMKVTGVAREDVGDRLALPDHGRYALRVIAWDWCSNAAVTTLDRPDEDAPPVDLRWSLDDALAVHAPLEAWRQSGAALPTARRSTLSPAVDGEGLALSIPKRTAVGSATVPVFGAMRVALPPEAAVVPAWRAPPPEGAVVEGLPVALFPATLLFVQRDELTPVRVDVTVPVYASGPVRPGELVEGWFGLDLARVLPAPLRPGQHCAWLAVGEHLSGPHPVEVIPG